MSPHKWQSQAGNKLVIYFCHEIQEKNYTRKKKLRQTREHPISKKQDLTQGQDTQTKLSLEGAPTKDAAIGLMKHISKAFARVPSTLL